MTHRRPVKTGSRTHAPIGKGDPAPSSPAILRQPLRARLPLRPARIPERIAVTGSFAEAVTIPNTRTLFDCSTFLPAAYGYAVAVRPLLQARRVPPGVQVTAGVAVFFAPLLVSPHHPTLRGFAFLIAADLMFKLIDYARHQRSGATLPRGFGTYAAFLIPFPALLVCFCKRPRRPGGLVFQSAALRSAIGGAVIFASGLALVFAVDRLPTIRASFLLDHVLKVAIFVPAIEALSRMLWGLEQLAGYDAPPLIQRAFRATTPGEFWSRYNTRVHAWLCEHVFLPSGGRRAPVRGLLLTFLASAVLHEAAFALATSRLDGYQFTFFMLQAPAVLASRPLHRFAVAHGTLGRLLARTVTALWFLASSMFFFHGVDRAFPFLYAAKPWLP